MRYENAPPLLWTRHPLEGCACGRPRGGENDGGERATAARCCSVDATAAGGRESPVMRPGRSPICAVSIEIRARALGKPGAQVPAASAGQIPQEEGSGPVGGCN